MPPVHAAIAPWQDLVGLLLGVAALVCLARLVRELRSLRSDVERIDGGARVVHELGELRETLRGLHERLPGERTDLAPVQAAVGELVAGLGRIEAQLEALRELRAEQLAAEEPAVTLVPPAPPAAPRVGLGERVTNRLLALGYERVQIVTDHELLDEIAEADGEALVEAWRNGVLHKGRVVVTAGEISAVDVHPSYSIFP